MAEASEQLTVLNEKLAIQRVAVKEKTEACEILLEEISAATQKAEEKKSQAVVKGKEIAEQSKIIESEKVSFLSSFSQKSLVRLSPKSRSPIWFISLFEMSPLPSHT